MRTKQHANGTTPVVRSVKKSAFHDVAFDTRIDVSCEREYTEQFAPRRDPIVFVFHDEFARIAQQLVNKKCHSTNAMHKMKMDPKTYTITDGMRFDTTAPVAQLPLSRQVRASASLDVEKREHRGELVPMNDHERRLVDVRPSNPHSYHYATQLGAKRPPWEPNQTPTMADARPSNPHAYFDATRLGKGQRFDSKHTPRVGEVLHVNPPSYYEFSSSGMHAVSFAPSDANVRSTNLAVQIDVGPRHMPHATAPHDGSKVRRLILKPVAPTVVTRKIVRTSCDTIVPRPARALKTSPPVEAPTYTVHKIRVCTQPESVVARTYVKLTPQSTVASHDFTHKNWHADVGNATGGAMTHAVPQLSTAVASSHDPRRMHTSNWNSDAGRVVRQTIKPPTHVTTYADLEASSAYTSERVEHHPTTMHVDSVHYSLSTTQSHTSASGRAEEMTLVSRGDAPYKTGGAMTVQSTTPHLPEMGLVVANTTPSRAGANARHVAHYTHVSYDQDIVPPRMHVEREGRSTRPQSRPSASFASAQSIPAEHATVYLDGHRPRTADVHHGHVVEFQPLTSVEDGRIHMSVPNADRPNTTPSSHPTVQARKSEVARHNSHSQRPLHADTMATVNPSAMNTETVHSRARPILPATPRYDAGIMEGRVDVSTAPIVGWWSGDVRPHAEVSEDYDDRVRLHMQTSMGGGYKQPNFQNAKVPLEPEKVHVQVDAMSIAPSLRMHEQSAPTSVDAPSRMHVQVDAMSIEPSLRMHEQSAPTSVDAPSRVHVQVDAMSIEPSLRMHEQSAPTSVDAPSRVHVQVDAMSIVPSLRMHEQSAPTSVDAPSRVHVQVDAMSIVPSLRMHEQSAPTSVDAPSRVHVQVDAMSIEPSLHATHAMGSTRMHEQSASTSVDAPSLVHVPVRRTLDHRREWNSVVPNATTTVFSTRNDAVHQNPTSNGHDARRDAPLVASHVRPVPSTFQIPGIERTQGTQANRHEPPRVSHGSTISNVNRANADGNYEYIRLGSKCHQPTSSVNTNAMPTVEYSVQDSVDSHSEHLKPLSGDGPVQISTQHRASAHVRSSHHQETTPTVPARHVPVSTLLAGNHMANGDSHTLTCTAESSTANRVDPVAIWPNTALEPARVAWTAGQSTAHPEPSPVSVVVGMRHVVGDATHRPTASHAGTNGVMYERVVLSRPSTVATSTAARNPCHGSNAQTVRVSDIGRVSARPAVHPHQKRVAVDDVETRHARTTTHSKVDVAPIKATFKTEGGIANPSFESSVRPVHSIRLNAEALVGQSSQGAVAVVTARDHTSKSVSHSLSVHEREFAPPKRDVLRKMPVLTPKRESIQFKSKGVVHKVAGGGEAETSGK